MAKLIGFYKDEKGRTRPITRGKFRPKTRPETKNSPTTKYIKASKEIDKLFKDPSYASFVEKLRDSAKDPKVRDVLIKGRMDGMILDDVVRYNQNVKKCDELKPIQREIDLEKSLKYIGQHPENVPLILQGGTLQAENFGGNPIVTSDDKFIVDGHHRWSQTYFINPDAKLETINLQIKNPEKALRASQVAIAAMTGNVPVQHVEKGKNVYKMSLEDIEKAIPDYLSPQFYEAFYKTKPDEFKTKEDVHNHLIKNIEKLRESSRPKGIASREHMPQFDEVGATKATEALAKGKINIEEPYIKETR
jgi:hypothetical protein